MTSTASAGYPGSGDPLTLWLRRQLRPLRLKIEEFLESDLGWVRILFLLVLSVLLIGLAMTLQYFLDPTSGSGWFTETAWLAFVPFPVRRFLGLLFHLSTLRFFLIPFITLAIALIAGSAYVKDIYNLKKYRLGIRYLFASLFGIAYPVLRIENGEMILNEGEINPLAVIGGPGYVLISPGNAVLFEHLRHPSSVRGEGLHFVSRFERIKEIIDLRDQHGVIERASAMSKDGLIVTVQDTHYRYRVAGVQRVSGNTGRSLDQPYPFSVQAIRNLVYNRTMRRDGVTPWADTIRTLVNGEILNYIRANLLDTVTAPKNKFVETDVAARDFHPRQEIRKRLMSKEFRRRLLNLGTELIWFDIGHFNFDDPAVEEQRISTWAADFVGDADTIRAFGEAQRKAFQELARAQAQAELVMSLVHSLREAGIAEEMHGEAMQKLILVKTAEVIEAMSTYYEPNPDGD